MLFKKPKLNKIKSCLHFNVSDWSNESHGDYKFPLLIFLFTHEIFFSLSLYLSLGSFDRKNNEVEYNGKNE